MKRKIFTLSTIFVMAMGLALSGCSGGGGSDGGGSGGVAKIKLSGTLSSDYVVAQNSSKSFFAKIFNWMSTAHASLLDGKVDKIIAVPTIGGGIHGSMMSYSVSTTVNGDGTFSMDLDKTFDWLLVLIDTTAATTDEKFTGYVALKADATESLLAVPTSSASVSELDLGTVSLSGDLALSGTTADTTQFSMTASELLNLAKNDDLMKNVKNLVLNYDSGTGIYYQLRADFVFDGDYASLENAFSAASLYQYQNYAFQLDSNQTAVTMDEVCVGVSQVSLQLYPPAGETIVTTDPLISYDASNPMSNSGATCTVAGDGFIEAWTPTGDFYATNRYGDVSFNFGMGMIGVIPAGYWQYKVDGAITGEFDVAVATPVTASDQISSFAPVLRVNTDLVTGMITSIDIKWFYLDGVSYVELTDISALEHLVGSADIYLDNWSSGPRRYMSYNIDPSTQTSITPAETWYFGTDGPADEQVEGFGVFFDSGGVGHHLQYSRP